MKSSKTKIACFKLDWVGLVAFNDYPVDIDFGRPVVIISAVMIAPNALQLRRLADNNGVSLTAPAFTVSQDGYSQPTSFSGDFVPFDVGLTRLQLRLRPSTAAGSQEVSVRFMELEDYKNLVSQ